MQLRWLPFVVLLAVMAAGDAVALESSSYTEQCYASENCRDNARAAARLIQGVVRDADSAKFRGMYQGNGPLICGEVNSKNAFGAYVGFEHFIVAGETVAMERSTDDFAKAWKQWCVSRSGTKKTGASHSQK